MNFTQIDPKYIALAIVVVVAIVLIGVAYARSRRAASDRIRQRFGPEYERTVRESGSQRRAEAELADRSKRVEKLKIRELAPVERERFTGQWNGLQARFVDSPKGAVAEADDLIVLLMETRGYPMANFDQRAADISVDHPVVVENYRAAHTIATRLSAGTASTEELRKAMIHYRVLFDEMIKAGAPIEQKDVA